MLLQLKSTLSSRIKGLSSVSMVFDKELHFVVISKGAELEWQKKDNEITGKFLLDVFPELTGSTNHRNILRALQGAEFKDVIQSRGGKIMRIHYCPLIIDNDIAGVEVHAVQANVRQ